MGQGGARILIVAASAALRALHRIWSRRCRTCKTKQDSNLKMLTKKEKKVKTLFSSVSRALCSAATSCQKSRAECCADCFTMEEIVHFINSYIIPSRSQLSAGRSKPGQQHARAGCSFALEETCIFVRHANGACSNTLIT